MPGARPDGAPKARGSLSRGGGRGPPGAGPPKPGWDGPCHGAEAARGPCVDGEKTGNVPTCGLAQREAGVAWVWFLARRLQPGVGACCELCRELCRAASGSVSAGLGVAMALALRQGAGSASRHRAGSPTALPRRAWLQG